MPSPTSQLLSQTIYLTDGVTSDWNFSFAGGYLDASHVKAYYLDSVGNKTQVTSFTLSGPYQLHTNAVIPAGQRLYIYRDTPKTAPLVDFSDGSSLTEVSLDTNAKQAVMIAAESADAVASSNIQDAIDAATDAANSAAAAAATAATIVADATALATAAATPAAVAAANAAVALATATAVSAAANALVSETNALDSFQDAQAQATLALGYANAASGYSTSASAAQIVATAQASIASASAAEAESSNVSATTAATESAVARDLAIAAWAASTAPAEQLASFSPNIHTGAVVKAVIYDTSKDSDGGAWRKRCTDKSWYNEALGGSRWIGKQPSEAVARAYVGSLASPELIVNGTFDTGVAGWTSHQGGILSVSSNRLLITNDGTGTNSGSAYQSFTTIIGRSYVLNITSIAGTSATALIRVGTALASSNLATQTGIGTYTIAFTATTTSTFLTLYTNSTIADRTAFFDNISVKIVDPVTLTADYLYQSTADGKFYRTVSTSGVSEVFRGISREFPAVAAIVAESSRVVIYDLTQSEAPMWRVYRPQGVGSVSNQWWRAATRFATSVVAINGLLAFGVANGTADNSTGLLFVNLPADTAGRYTNNTGNGGVGPHTVTDTAEFTTRLPYIVNQTVNDVAITVLDNAPIDPSTQLPVPTILVGTAGGVSVIRNTGLVESTASTTISKVLIDKTHFRAVAQTRVACALPIGSTLPAGGGSHLNAYWTALVYLESSIPAISGLTTTGAIVSGASGNTTALTLLKENPVAQAKGMVDYITNAYNSGWQVGDSRGAYMADTIAENVTELNVVSNGTFTVDTTGWVAEGGATLSVESGELRVLGDGSTPLPIAKQNLTLVVGKMYELKFSITTSNTLGITLIGETLYPSSGAGYYYPTAIGNYVVYFTATNAARTLRLVANSTGAIGTNRFDNVSCNLCDADRSVKSKGFAVKGTLPKTAVASGASLVAYSGFNALNSLEQPYNSQLDFGTGDFCIMGWLNTIDLAAATITVFGRALLETYGGITCDVTSTGALELYASNSTAVVLAATTNPSSGYIKDGVWNLVEFGRASNYAYIRLNGVQLVSTFFTDNLTYSGATSRLGSTANHSGALQAATYANMALWRISATVPSADQIAQIYRTELPMFQPNAQCTIAGTSTATTALAYDDVADVLHVGTSWGRSEFKNLVRVASEATTTGSITALSANEGVILTGGTSAKVYAPAMYLRDELRRKDVARKALGRIPVFFDFTATAAQAAFVAPKGYTIKALYKNGTLMREATTGTYWTRSNDGFQETATLSVGASVSDWISIMCVRA